MGALAQVEDVNPEDNLGMGAQVFDVYHVLAWKYSLLLISGHYFYYSLHPISITPGFSMYPDYLNPKTAAWWTQMCVLSSKTSFLMMEFGL